MLMWLTVATLFLAFYGTRHSEVYVPAAWRRNENDRWHSVEERPDDDMKIEIAYYRFTDRKMLIISLLLMLWCFAVCVVKIISFL